MKARFELRKARHRHPDGAAGAAWLLALVAALSVGGPAQGAQSLQSCDGFVDALPAVITGQGVWCLRRDLSTGLAQGAALAVAVPNVTIDCNGFKIGGLAAGPATQASGISVETVRNVTVRRCNIRGFRRGIDFLGSNPDLSGGHVVEGNRMEANTEAGIAVVGRNSVVRDNLVFDTGGSTLATPVGILALGRVSVTGNAVHGVVPGAGFTGESVGILASGGTGSLVAGNRISGVLANAGGEAIGLRVNSLGRGTIRGNVVLGTAIPASVGILCVQAGVRARDNTVSGFPAGIQSCGNGGGNDAVP